MQTGHRRRTARRGTNPQANLLIHPHHTTIIITTSHGGAVEGMSLLANPQTHVHTRDHTRCGGRSEGKAAKLVALGAHELGTEEAPYTHATIPHPPHMHFSPSYLTYHRERVHAMIRGKYPMPPYSVLAAAS